MRAKLLQSCPTLCDPGHCGPPGFTVHGVLQARILERFFLTRATWEALFLRDIGL